MLFKMLGIERTWEDMRKDSDSDIFRPRQVFVTQSKVLAERVQEYYTKLTESHAAAQRTAQESAALAAKKEDRRAQGLVNRDEEEIYHGTLPKRWGDLQDEHFPLFLTFDHVSHHFFFARLVSSFSVWSDYAALSSPGGSFLRRSHGHLQCR